MDKYLLERIQIFLSRGDLLNLRETSQFHAACEWFGPGWTVVLSPLVHDVRRPTWDLSEDLQEYLWSSTKTRERSDWPLPADWSSSDQPHERTDCQSADWDSSDEARKATACQSRFS